jgi:AraC-like DNA-binding protein
MSQAKYYNNIKADFSNDRLGVFLNSITVVPHHFGHQYGSVENSTHGYRLIGDFEIIFFISGESYISVGDKKYLCKKDDFVFIPPFVRHSIDTTLEDPHDNYWIHFDIEPLSSRQKFIELFTGSGEYMTRINNYDILRYIYFNLEKEYESNVPGFLALFKASILYILVQVLKNIDTKHEIIDNVIAGLDLQLFANKILAYINENIDDIDSVKSVCQEYNISRTHINNIFMKTIGVSPGKMIRHIKLKKAENLLLTTDMSLDEISEILGFSSASHFSNAFKKNYCLSPNTYRKNIL